MKNRILFIVFLGMLLSSPGMAVLAQQDAEAPVVPGGNVVDADQGADPALEISIETKNKTFKVGEKVVFDLVVTNAGKYALKTFTIDDKTTFCSINGQNWGTKAPSGDPVVILMPGESIRKKFKISGMAVPGDLKVDCSYGMKVKGIQPGIHKVFQVIR